MPTTQGRDHQDSLLRSILLFRSLRSAYSKDELQLIPIFAFVESAPECTAEEISKALLDRFCLDIPIPEIKQRLQALVSKGHLASSDSIHFHSAESESSRSNFDADISNRKKALIEGVIARIRRNPSDFGLSDKIWNQVRKNAGQAISEYFHQYGYCFFGLKKKPAEDQINHAVEVALWNLETKIGNSLVAALYDLINNPSQEEKTILESFARAYVTMEILNLDPALRNFKLSRLGAKTFVVDTDVILHTITSKASHSSTYRLIAEKLVNDVAATIVIPRRVLEEVKQHVVAAFNTYAYLSPNIDALPDEILSNENVFVEDYARIRRTDPDAADLDFDSYMRRFKVRNNFDLLVSRIKERFGANIVFWEEEDLVALSNDQQRRIAALIQKKTESQAKGAFRTEAQNEGIAETDARIYLTVRQKNKNSDSLDTPFGSKIYLLTGSRKINRSVESVLGIGEASSDICNPNALYAILQEMGAGVKGEPVEYINLFDNPFLHHASEMMWEKARPIITQKTGIRHDDFETLRMDFETRLDDELSAASPTEELEKAYRLRERGYSMGNAIIEAKEKLAKAETENQSLKKEYDILKLKFENISKENAKKKYLDRIATDPKASRGNKKGRKRK